MGQESIPGNSPKETSPSGINAPVINPGDMLKKGFELTDRIPFNINGKWGYLDKNGIAIKPKFDEAQAFMGDTALVRLGKDWLMIDKSGNIVETYGLPEDFKMDYQKENPYQQITPNGNVINFTAIEVFNTSEETDKDLMTCSLQGRKISIDNLSKVIASMTKLDSPCIFLIIYDQTASQQKIDMITSICKKFGAVNQKLIKTDNLNDKIKNRKTSTPAETSSKDLNIISRKEIEKDVLFKDSLELQEKCSNLKMKSADDYEKALKMYADFLEKYKKQSVHPEYRCIRSFYEALKKKEVYGPNAFDKPGNK